jgi:hypothetical protein
MVTATSRPSWLSYYHAIVTEKGPDQNSFNSDLSANNKKCEECCDEKTKFINTILESEKLGFLILPVNSTTGRINILHNCTYDEKGADEAKFIGKH